MQRRSILRIIDGIKWPIILLLVKLQLIKKVSSHKIDGYTHGSLIHAKLIPAILAKGMFLGKEEAKQFFYLRAKVNLEEKIYIISLSLLNMGAVSLFITYLKIRLDN